MLAHCKTSKVKPFTMPESCGCHCEIPSETPQKSALLLSEDFSTQPTWQSELTFAVIKNNSDRRIYSYVTAVPRRGSLEEDGGVVGQMEKPRFRTACKVLPLQLRHRLLAWNLLVYLFSPPLPSSQPPAVMRSKDLTYICWINKWSQGSELVVLEIHCHKQTLSCVEETLAFY